MASCNRDANGKRVKDELDAGVIGGLEGFRAYIVGKTLRFGVCFSMKSPIVSCNYYYRGWTPHPVILV